MEECVRMFSLLPSYRIESRLGEQKNKLPYRGVSSHRRKPPRGQLESGERLFSLRSLGLLLKR